MPRRLPRPVSSLQFVNARTALAEEKAAMAERRLSVYGVAAPQ